MKFDADFFALFGLPLQYAVDLKQLNTQYRQLQKEYHPDRYASAPDAEQRAALQFAAYINEGLEVLRSPVKRAAYLLGLAKVDVKADNLAGDPSFLMQQIELREELGDIADNVDASAKLEQFIATVQMQQLALETQFEQYYQAQNYQDAVMLISKMQFLVKLLNEAEQVEDTILLG